MPDPDSTAAQEALRPRRDETSPRVLRLVRDQQPPAPTPVQPSGPGDVPAAHAASPALERSEISSVLEDIVRRFAGSMRRTAYRHGIDASELDDIVQDTRIRLWHALDSPEKLRLASPSYIYRTTVSATLDGLRRRRARREDSLDDASPHLGNTSHGAPRHADASLDEGDIKDAVNRAVNLLSESRRGVVRMYLAGYGREEIAKLLGWSEAKTRNLLYRGLGDVRVSLESWGYGPGAAR